MLIVWIHTVSIVYGNGGLDWGGLIDRSIVTSIGESVVGFRSERDMSTKLLIVLHVIRKLERIGVN